MRPVEWVAVGYVLLGSWKAIELWLRFTDWFIARMWKRRTRDEP